MFIGRKKEITTIENFVFNSKKQFLYIYGKRGIGKTSLIHHFIQKNRKRLNNKITTLNSFNFESIPNNFINSDNEVLIVDDYHEFLGNTAMSPTIPAYSLRTLINNSKANKVIMLSPDPPFLFSGDLKDKIDFLEILSLSKKELDVLFRGAFKAGIDLNLNDFYIYFDKNPRSILTALNYFQHSNYQSGLEFLDYLNKPIQQSGLVDLQGNPLTTEKEEAKKITQTLEIVNTSLLEKVKDNPQLIFEFSPRKFEVLVAEMLEKEGFNVTLTKQTRDGGKDIFVAQKNNLGNFLYYVECKKYAPENPVGVNLVRELYGTISADRATAGLLVTSSYFSPDAIAFTQNLQHQLSLKGFIEMKRWVADLYKN